jgi:hypothetical protein
LREKGEVKRDKRSSMEGEELKVRKRREGEMKRMREAAS